ncbi:MAG TPA: hypothetical protein VIY48_11875 [Candidatus Paceibacterota bacterium]
MPDIALLTFTGGPRSFVVRTNPNYISYSYQLRTKTFSTYGGKVVQILGVNYGPLLIEVESGSSKEFNGQDGGFAYFKSVIQWFKETSLWQRNFKRPISFIYPERNYVLDVFLKRISIADDLRNVVRPLQIEMEIEDDFTCLLTGDIIANELKYFQDGIGYEVSPYNDPLKGVVDEVSGPLSQGEHSGSRIGDL